MITISADTTLKGELKSKGRIRVDGRVEGNGEIEGLLVLSQQAYWKGNLAADIVIVEGTVDGDITAYCKLEIRSNAKVNGRMSSPAVLFKSGAQINGDLDMRGTTPLRLIEDKSRQKVSVLETAASLTKTV